MWPAELIGFLHAMACTKEGREALVAVDETGVPHRGLRGLLAESKTGGGNGSLRDIIRLYLTNLGVKFDPKKSVFENVSAHATQASAAEKRRGPLMAEVRSLATELYECTRTPTIGWPSERIGHLVRCIQEVQEMLRS